MDVRKKSQKQEKSVAKSIGGRVTPASGALWGAKGDVRSDKFLIECKTTDKPLYSVKKQIWQKICEEALQDNLRIPVMCISVQNNDFALIAYKHLRGIDGELDSVIKRTRYKNTIPVHANDILAYGLEDCYIFSYLCWDKYTPKLETSLALMRWETFLKLADKIGGDF